MEYLDTYDEEKNFIGTFSRDEVHLKGMWHNTVHCWLYDKTGNIYFQLREGQEKGYTTASGHVQAGETIRQAFGREVKEEIGIDVNYENATFVAIIPWRMDKEKNGIVIKDRAFSNVYVCEIEEEIPDFVFDVTEVAGVMKVNAKEVYALFQNKMEEVSATIIKREQDQIILTKRMITNEDFIVMSHETISEKYGFIIEKVLQLCNL